MASWAAADMARYSASVVERDTVGCFLEAQEIAPEPMLNTYAEIERTRTTLIFKAQDYRKLIYSTSTI